MLGYIHGLNSLYENHRIDRIDILDPKVRRVGYFRYKVPLRDPYILVKITPMSVEI